MINKWDLINKDTNSAKKFEEKLNNKITPQFVLILLLC